LYFWCFSRRYLHYRYVRHREPAALHIRRLSRDRRMCHRYGCGERVLYFWHHGLTTLHHDIVK